MKELFPQSDQQKSCVLCTQGGVNVYPLALSDFK